MGQFVKNFNRKTTLTNWPFQVLHKAMKGMGTNDSTLIRVVVTRTEMDMQYIKAAYYQQYHKTLVEAIHSEISGHYRTFIEFESLVGHSH